MWTAKNRFGYCRLPPATGGYCRAYTRLARSGESQDSTSVLPTGRAAGRSGALAGLPHCAGGDGPLHLSRIPVAAAWRGDSMLVESLGNTSCGGNALLAQGLDGCQGGILDHHNGRKPRPALPANTRSGCTPACLVVLHVCPPSVFDGGGCASRYPAEVRCTLANNRGRDHS
jgi:hypothetical protein